MYDGTVVMITLQRRSVCRTSWKAGDGCLGARWDPVS